MTTDIVALGIAGLARALQAGTVTSVTATDFYLTRIAEQNEILNAFITVTR